MSSYVQWNTKTECRNITVTNKLPFEASVDESFALFCSDKSIGTTFYWTWIICISVGIVCDVCACVVDSLDEELLVFVQLAGCVDDEMLSLLQALQIEKDNVGGPQKQ